MNIEYNINFASMLNFIICCLINKLMYLSIGTFKTNTYLYGKIKYFLLNTKTKKEKFKC